MSTLGSSAAGGSSTALLENTARYKRNLAKYARLHGLTKAKRNHIQRETRRLAIFGEGLRNKPYIAEPKVLTQALTDAWGSFRGNINGLPVYYVACHGSTCASYAQCGAPERDTNPPTYPYPSFTLPDTTFMINLVNGEICQVTRFTEHALLSNQDNFKNALLVDSPNESTQRYEPSWESPILSGIYRSSPGSTYPNYKCRFEQSTYRMGVFNLSVRNEHGDATRVYYPTEEEMRGSIFIEDVIRRTLERSGPGIFILGACSGPYGDDLPSIIANNYATELIRDNELAYTTRHPTLSLAQIKLVDPSFSIRDFGSVVQVGVPHPALMAELAAAHREVPRTIFPPGRHPENLNEANALLSQLKKHKNFRTTYRHRHNRPNKRQSQRLRKKHTARSI
jgi:hypothetical protein